MAQKSRVVISIDLASSATADELSFVNRTLDLLDQVEVPATWTSSELQSPEVAAIASRNGHEIALAGDLSWATPNRTMFAEGLREQIKTAVAAGLRVRTLQAPATAVDGRWDLLVRHQITSLRLVGGPVGKQSAESARFGVHLAPPSLDLHGEFPWWTGGVRAAARRALHQSIQNSQVTHMAMGVRQVVANNREAAVHAVLQDVANRARYGLVDVITLSSLAQTHRVLRTGTGRSVLRVA